MRSISKLKAVLIVCLIVVAASTVGYYYYVQTRVSSPSSQVPTPSPSPTSSPTASSPSPSPSASPISSPLSTSTTLSQPTPTPTQAPTPTPIPPGYYLSQLSINPIEPWPGDPITITAQLTNNEINGNTSVSLNIDGQLVSTQTGIQTSSGTSEPITFTTTAGAPDTYSVQLDTQTGSSLTGSFTVAPNGEYTLSISTPYPDISFTLDGVSETTPYSSLVAIGNHTIVMPQAVDAYTFQSWADDGSTDPTRTIDVEGPTSLTADYSGGGNRGSCPSLYVWNGTAYSYAAEVNDGTGWLGFVDYYQPDGTAVYAYNYPYDYIKLDSTQLEPINGFYNMKITQISDEIFYLDSVKMIAVDHPADVNVFSTASTFIYNLTGQGTIYTVSTNLATPVSAVNGTGQNVLPQISKLDGIFTTGTRWAWNSLTLNLGNLAGAKQINLVVAAKVTWPTTYAGGQNFLNYANTPGICPSPPPYMQVMAANGSWVMVPNDREFPIPHVTDSVFVVNLTGLFPTNNYELKINTYQDIQFDYIGISTTPQQNIIVHTITPSYADLQQAFSTNSNSSGAFTKYGDVTALLQSADDQFVIGRQGDSVSLQFPADLPPVPKGWVRDYFIIASCWFKGEGLSYVPFTVNPLPFQAMTSFPYPSNESYPYDAAHLAYLQKYDTRSIEAQTADPFTQSASGTFNQIREPELIVAYAASATLLASAVIILAYKRRKRAKRVIS